MKNRCGWLKSGLLLSFALWSSFALFSQNPNWIIDESYNNLTWTEFVERTEANFALQFFYDPDSLKHVKPAQIAEPVSIGDFLDRSFQNTGFNISYDINGNIFIAREFITTSLPANIYQDRSMVGGTSDSLNNQGNDPFLNTSQEHIARVIDIGSKKDGVSKRKATISGYLRDSKTGDPIIGATVMVIELQTGTASNENGFYQLTLKKGTYTLVINNINHQEEKVSIHLLSDGEQNFQLENKSVLLDDVVVTSDRFNKVQSNKMGFERITLESIKEVPLVLGEKDILKVANLLAGVQTVGEGASGFNVRGSPADQNLFYVDKVPIYNTSHMFGFFSAFNSEAISEFSLSKSSIPAKFGGRLASIFDITALEGDKQKYKLRGGISPITGNLLFEGPIQKDKSSVMIGLRSTYSNWVLKLVKNRDFNNTRANFADGMVKLSFELNPKNRVQAFAYYSYDEIDFANTFNFDNNNLGSSMSWSHYFNPSSSFNFSLIYSKLELDVENSETLLDAYTQKNTLEHKEARVDFTWQAHEKHTITAGANTILYGLDRGTFEPSGALSLIEPVILGKEQGLESGLYLSDEFRITNQFTVTAGLRYNLYSYLGPQEVFNYRQNATKIPENIVDTLQFGENERIKTYSGLDYRVSARYVVNPDFSIKASYNTLHQYIFLLSNTIALAPTDKWKLTDYNIKPMTGHQFSVGFYKNLYNDRLELSFETYYKKVLQLVEYRDGADLLVNEFPEQDVLQGDLDAYGFELMLKKTKGDFSGWINYTYSNARAQVRGDLEEDLINFGASYPTNYDKPHALNVVTNYKFTRRFSVSANLVYSTGRPITYPTTVYQQNGIQLINFTNRNEYRVPDYFRTDLSVKFEGNLKSKKLLHGSWILSVYNVTGRRNAYSVYFQSVNGQISGRRVSIFAYPIFSVSYNFKFGNYEN